VFVSTRAMFWNALCQVGEAEDPRAAMQATHVLAKYHDNILVEQSLLSNNLCDPSASASQLQAQGTHQGSQGQGSEEHSRQLSVAPPSVMRPLVAMPNVRYVVCDWSKCTITRTGKWSMVISHKRR